MVMVMMMMIMIIRKMVMVFSIGVSKFGHHAQEEAVERGFVESPWEPAGPPWTGHISNGSVRDGQELLARSWRGSGWSFQSRRGLGNCRLCATAADDASSASSPRLHQDEQHRTRSGDGKILQDAGLLVSLPKVTQPLLQTPYGGFPFGTVIVSPFARVAAHAPCRCSFPSDVLQV